MNIPAYNKIDTKKDSIDVIQSKINAMKAAVAEGTMTAEDYAKERIRVESESELVGYAFTW